MGVAADMTRDESSLAEAMRGGVSTPVALYAARAILSALEEVHARGLVQLELDPEHVFVRADGSLRLPEPGRWSALEPAALARARFDAGRVAYSSPELVQARKADARSDLFVVGWLLYEWLAEAAPFTGQNALALALAIDGAQRKPLLQRAPRVDPGLCDVVEMLLQTAPSHRFQTASAARSALQAVAPFDAEAARRELAARVMQRSRASEPRTRRGVAPSKAALLENPFVKPSPRQESELVEPPPLFLSGASSAVPLASARAPRALAMKGEPVHDGRTAFLRVESALRTVLPRKWQTSSHAAGPRTIGPRVVPGKWQDPSSTLFRVRRAALSGPVVRVAGWPRTWWVALGIGLGVPVVTCAYLLYRLWLLSNG